MVHLSYLADLEDPRLVDGVKRCAGRSKRRGKPRRRSSSLAIEPKCSGAAATDRCARPTQGGSPMKSLTPKPLTPLATMARALLDRAQRSLRCRGAIVSRAPRGGPWAQLPGEIKPSQGARPDRRQHANRRSVRGATGCGGEGRTVKLTSLVPPIRFEVGVAKVGRDGARAAPILDRMRDRRTCGCTSWAMPTRSRCRRRWRPCSATTKACRASAPARLPSS